MSSKAAVIADLTGVAAILWQVTVLVVLACHWATARCLFALMGVRPRWHAILILAAAALIRTGWQVHNVITIGLSTRWAAAYLCLSLIAFVCSIAIAIRTRDLLLTLNDVSGNVLP